MSPDIVSKTTRSRMMSGIRSKNTNLEIAVRRIFWRAGYRYRLHKKDLAGSPDIVLPKYRLAIFVHGCYWHRHNSCKLAYIPKTNKQFWQSKFEQNKQRDHKNSTDLLNQGWSVLIIWECLTRNPEMLESRIKLFMDSYHPANPILIELSDL